MTMEISRQSVAKFLFPKGELKEQPLWNILLNNNNELFGTLAAESFVINQGSTPVTIKPDDIASMTFDPEAMNMVTVKLFNDTTITGSLQADKITVQIQPGLKLDIYTMHISEMTHTPPPPPQPETPETVPDTTTPPVTSSVSDEEKANAPEIVKKMEAELNALKQEAAALAAEQQKLASEGKNEAAAEVGARLDKAKAQIADLQQKISAIRAKLDN